MSYYQGDYYRGDPGIFGDIWGGIKKVGRIGAGVVGLVNPVAGGIMTKVFGGGQQTAAAPQLRQVRGLTMNGAPPPILAAAAAPAPGLAGKGARSRAAMGLPAKRRRMNVTNDKALRRAVRRTDGFVKLAKRALRGTAYTVVSRSSRVKRVNVRESGAGSVTVH